MESAATLRKRNIREYFMKHRAALLTAVPAVVIFLLATYRLSETGQPILFNDEIGYWSNSAFFLGMDWTSVTERIGYYSYGYSLLLALVRLLGNWSGWDWKTLHHAAVIMNAGFLVMSYVIAIKLAKRYLPEMKPIVRIMACFTVFTYSSYIVYAHITWTECTLMFFFWVYLYVMMRLTDQPGIGNHIAYALLSFYIYTVHQRALGIVVTSVIIVVCMRILRCNKIRDVAAFLGSMYVCGLIHGMVKKNLQSVNYLGEESLGFRGTLEYVLMGNFRVFFAIGAVVLILLWLLEKRRYKAVFVLVAGGVMLGTWFLRQKGAELIGGEGNRLSLNDFSGQWEVIRNLFTRNGLIRLGISMTGKWFYMASVTGLVVCWGIFGLFQNAFILCRESIMQAIRAYQGRKRAGFGADDNDKKITGDMIKGDTDRWRERIWLLGVLLAWFSTFMISAIYKEGFYKNDDLVNGRYTEFVLGFVLLFGLYRLQNAKKWVCTTMIYMVLYILAGILCQWAWDELQRTEFELAHCVMFGRVVWNYEVPNGKIAELWRYILPMTASFILLLKPAGKRLPKLAAARAVVALMIPVIAWSYLGRTIVDQYVVVRNEKQEEPFVQFVNRIRLLYEDEPVYYISDSYNDRQQGLLQFMLQEIPVSVVDSGETLLEEDAFYVMKNHLWSADGTDAGAECEVIGRLNGYILAIRKDGEPMKRWEPFKKYINEVESSR
ncbi:MAG: hypothetical protein NC430_08030 [bacterium]|nr:hypothetical protein [bacterium]